MRSPCIASYKGGDVEYYFAVAVHPGKRFERIDFDIIRDTLTLYMKVLEEGIDPDDIWEGEPH